MPQPSCDFAETLIRFAAQAPDEAEAQRLRVHLGQCSICQQRLAAAAEHTPTASVLQAGASVRGLADTGFERLMSAILDKGAEPGETLCGYRILEELGRGGMGRVYLAEHPRTGQQVALKVLRAEASSREFLVRFEAERQALALMEHPNIARVLDSGLSDDGRPFFAMELVQGADLIDWCNDHRQSIHQRCELFIQVCQAVQHAHQKGIIHRDIKPSNVLVTQYDRLPVPKVIDFGVAKAVGNESATQTQDGVIVGTPQYMSPEQASLSHAIDTRSDVYALGILLYELLTGDTPFGHARGREAPILELLRSIREDEAPAPSSRLATTDTKVEVAAQRDTEPGRLIKQVRGELDWIVLKALEKDPARRYDSAAALADDVRRCLNAEPVLAGPPSRRYRLQKFVQRNRLATAAIAAFALLLLAATGVSTGLAWWANSERLRAEGAEKDAKQFAANELQARGLAEGRLKEVGRANGILLGIFRDLNPRGTSAGDEKSLRATMGERLLLAARLLDEKALADPNMAAEITEAIGLSLLNLGRHEAAIPLLARAVEGYTKLSGPEHADTLTARNSLATAYVAAGRLPEALATFEQLVSIRVRVLGPDHPDTLATQNNLGSTYQAAGRVKEAVALHERTLAERVARLGPNHRGTVTSRNNLASAVRASGDLNRAYTILQENVRACTEAFGPQHVDTLSARNNLAALLGAMGRVAEGIPELEAVLAARTEQLGRDHPETLVTRHNLAEFYREVRRVNEAVTMQEETMRLRTAKLGPVHPLTLATKNSLAKCYLAAGRKEEGLQLHENCYRSRIATLGPDHPETLKNASDLGVAYRQLGRNDEAIALYEATLVKQKKQCGPDHPDSQLTLGNLARAHFEAKHYPDAERLWRELIDIRHRTLPSDSLLLAGSLGWLGELLLLQNRHLEAEPFLREAYSIRRKKEPTSGSTIEVQLQLGQTLLALKQFPEAEALLLNGFDALTKKRTNTAVLKLLGETRANLVRLYQEWGKPQQATQWQETKPPPPATTKPQF